MTDNKRRTKKGEGERLNLQLNSSVRDRMVLLREDTGARTLTEVVSRALAVYDYLWAQRKAGAKVMIQDSGGTRELVLL